MEPHDVPATLAALAELRVSAATTELDAAAAMPVLADFNDCIVGTVRFSGQTPWERHPGDELLYIVEGSVDVTVLLDDAAHDATLNTGSVFVGPRGAMAPPGSAPRSVPHVRHTRPGDRCFLVGGSSP